MKMTVAVVIVISVDGLQMIMKWVLATCKNNNFKNDTFICLFDWLVEFYILKEWLTISRGTEPSAQKPKIENRKRITDK